MDDLPKDAKLPCGCVLYCAVANGVRTLYMTACDAGCEVVAEVKRQGRTAGKRVEFKLPGLS